MGNIKQINIKNRTYYFLNDMISTQNFASNLFKIGKKSCKNIDIYYIGYFTIKDIGKYENIHSVNTLHLIIGEADGYIEEKNKNKYLFLLQIKTKKVLTKHTELSDEIKYLIITINGDEAGEFGKEYMKIKFNSDDNLSIKKVLNLHNFNNSCSICLSRRQQILLTNFLRWMFVWIINARRW